MTMRSRNVLAVVCSLLAALALGACGGDDDDGGGGGGNSSGGGGGEPVKVAVVFPFQAEGDLYNEVHAEALEKAVQNVGADKIELKIVYGVPYTDRMTRTVEQLFQQGNDVVIDGLAAGELFTNACKKVPDGICIGYYAYSDPAKAGAPNVQAYYVDDAPMYYAEGVAAGLLTKSETVGFVSAFRLPFNTALLNSFALGCQSVKPNCRVRNVYVNSFYDPPKSTEATNSLIDAGADVINHFMDDITPATQAQKRGAMAFGAYKDFQDKAPEAWITGVLWAPALEKDYTQMFQELADGSFKPNGPVVFGSDQPPDMELAPFGKNVPKDVQDKTLKVLEAVKNGENPFVGPIKDASGKVRIPEGEEIDLRGSFIYGEWNWAVEGVVGF
jgi:basic membrane protein A and related proteins